MPRILIFNGAPGEAQRRISALGAPTNEEMFSSAIGQHARQGEAMEFFRDQRGRRRTLATGHVTR